MKLKILVGTTTNTAESVAQSIELDCADLVDQIEVQLMDGLDVTVFDEPALFLICSATYGSGDVPDNAQALFASLCSEPKFLGHVRYGVMSLGDQGSYPMTFAMGGRQFDEKLSDLGAQRLGDVWTHDASSGVVPEDAGIAWCREWLNTHLPVLRATAPAQA
ncbi:flavodoxin domain-containing protein [Macromonas nakdongensis]|uniref:flavodoxin domain-containing protein n=1 Tax=Macromonas nakdongensis TaxID=1843082 RepID=UPI000C32DF76|nr:flavodoxin domain-containing protein [Macromonas nakdongensis]